MAIQVLCGSCKATFSVSDRFAGQTGPCPKCKAPIKIPDTPVQGVVVHEPEAPSTTAASGRAPTAPLARFDRPVTPLQWTLLAVGVVLAVAASLVARFQFPDGPPAPFLLAATGLLALPCAWLGYAAIRDRDLAPHSGRSLLVRTLVCAAVYAGLWWARSFLPDHIDLWEWIYYGPVFVAVGAFAAFATFDFEPGAAIGHFSLFVLVSAALRWLAGVTHL